MQKITRTITIKQEHAIRGGQSTWGERTITIAPAQLSQEDRDILAKTENLFSWSSWDSSAPNFPELSGAEPDIEIVKSALAWQKKYNFWLCEKEKTEKAARQLAREREQREEQEFATSLLAAYLAIPPEKLAEREEASEMMEFPGPIYAKMKSWDLRDAVYSTPEGEAHRQLASALRKNRHEAERIEAERIAAEEDAAAQRRVAQIADWVKKNGSKSQRDRHASGVLPEDEVLYAMRDAAYAPLGEQKKYEKITSADVIHGPVYCHGHISYSAEDAATIPADKWDEMERIRALIPGAELTLRTHIAECDDCKETEERYSLRVAIRVGEFDFSREYAI